MELKPITGSGTLKEPATNVARTGSRKVEFYVRPLQFTIFYTSRNTLGGDGIYFTLNQIFNNNLSILCEAEFFLSMDDVSDIHVGQAIKRYNVHK